MKIPYVDFPKQYAREKEEMLNALDRVLSSGVYIGGEEVKKFEENFATYIGVKHAIAVANGTDSLIMMMKCLGIGPGDEVITCSNSWVSSASSIALTGATPRFVDVREDQNMDPHLLEKAITKKTKAIMPVHLTGKSAKMDQILEIAQKHNIYVIEDAAQAVGAKYHGKKCGSMGIMSSFSLHPLKNLNACGDAGIVTTNDDALAQKIKLMREHGMPNRNTVEFWGYNSRLDALQAAILNVRMKYLDQLIAKRRENAAIYHQLLKGLAHLPLEEKDCFDSYHIYVIQCDRRDELKKFLEDHGVTTAIHYPTPIHLQPAAKSLGYKQGDFPMVELQSKRILSLPINQELNRSDIEYVCQTIKKFYQS